MASMISSDGSVMCFARNGRKKKRYPDRETAEKYRKKTKEYGVATDAYDCPECEWWHLKGRSKFRWWRD